MKGSKSHEMKDQEIPSGVEREEVFKRRAGGMLNRGRLGVKKGTLTGSFFYSKPLSFNRAEISGLLPANER